MKPPDAAKSDLVRQWLAKADEDLGLARHILQTDAPFLNAAAFHAQQAAEKYLKAFLVWLQVPFPKTHDLEILLKLIAARNPSLAESLEDAVQITDYGVEVRYPGDVPPLSLEEASNAVAIADKTHQAVATALKEAAYSFS